MSNQNFPRMFLIEFDGQFVVNPGSIDDDSASYDRIPAKTGNRADAAIFEFHDGLLRKAGGVNAMFFGRHRIEPRAYMALPVYWVPDPSMVQRCEFEGDESSPKALKSLGWSIGCVPGEGSELRSLPPQMYPEPKMKLHWQ